MRTVHLSSTFLVGGEINFPVISVWNHCNNDEVSRWLMQRYGLSRWKT